MPRATPSPPPTADEDAHTARDPRRARSRAALIEAATRLLAEGGIQAVTIDAVTRTARVARATLYRHFTTGTELLAAAFEQLLPAVAPTPDEGTMRDRLVTLLTEQARLLQEAPLYITVLSWLSMDTHAEPHDTHESAERPQRHQLRQRIIDQYRRPFDAILTSPTAVAELGSHVDAPTTLAQLVGPLIFNRLVTHEPIDRDFCTHIVDDYLTARHASTNPKPGQSS